MANEATIINNPDSTPGKASTGYGLQNTNLVAQRNGIDHTVIEAGAGPQVKCKISGPVDVNGVLYVITSQVNLTITGGADRYYIYLEGSGNSLSPKLTTDSGTFSNNKNARYTAAGYRILNWIIDYDGADVYVHKWLQPNEDIDLNIYNAEIDNDLDIGGDLDIRGDLSIDWGGSVTPIAGWLVDGTPYYIKELDVTFDAGYNTTSVNHGISNASTNDRIFNAIARYAAGGAYEIIYDSDYAATKAIVRYAWNDTIITLVKVSASGGSTTYKVKIWYT